MRPSDDQLDQLALAVAAGNITYTDEPAALPPKPDGETMAVYSVRLPTDTAEQLATVAASRGVKPSTLMRQMIEQCLATEANDHPISLADALRALTTLRPAA
ncbi:CopG family transcriptional regulator [Dactylosporangium sp. CS-047395]|uniref:ribbon-helix-helix domain-containing protein n=1 Tax=Dactylosporangium sp. CS-047395 TaxID=3239936 RepID=UPI003D9390E3